MEGCNGCRLVDEGRDGTRHVESPFNLLGGGQLDYVIAQTVKTFGGNSETSKVQFFKLHEDFSTVHALCLHAITFAGE